MLEATDLPGVDEDLALRIIAVALTIAPGLDALEPESRSHKAALAILRSVAQDTKIRGPRSIAAQRIGPASINYINGSSFTADDRAALRALCGPSSATGGPIGRFPRPGTLDGVWPEPPYDA